MTRVYQCYVTSRIGDHMYLKLRSPEGVVLDGYCLYPQLAPLLIRGVDVERPFSVVVKWDVHKLRRTITVEQNRS